MRFLDYEYLNRKIVWNEISQFFTFLLPFINKSGALKIIKKVFLFTTLLGPMMNNFSEESESLDHQCKVCGDSPPTLPIRLKSCGHLYCRYCFHTLKQLKCLRYLYLYLSKLWRGI